MNISLQPGETNLGTWTLLYLPPSGGKYNGKLTVTSKRLLYDAMFDVSFKGTGKIPLPSLYSDLLK